MNRSNQLSALVSKRAAKHLSQFRRDVERSFQHRVREVVLFGSRARGDSTRTSDYDVAVVLEEDGFNRREITHTLSDLAYPHVIAGVHIRPVYVGDSALQSAKARSTVFDIERDGVSIP
ncbi:nucleotidyltransferase domain-containing protein [Rhizobium leguminosarum]|uniref:nucleotidyltransferase family protein n=1 Tax=Rhizobium leguminosarum TaxID=384 RepID=UPI001C93A0AB|nr:nucleotidyltransferase domain-containing protein [Rhizobium leguminosarum]MBY5667401.1 nucleotidyltransferase domain-containing protein [Rhizobium leguminosarum]MBY5710095.1 nucleotidyltransferase domain-containing protein [Rhizobium leguminosarum]MBY5721546.1 nucleotidyltransferase domain-containing protein [Rhizobium leguminosarum]